MGIFAIAGTGYRKKPDRMRALSCSGLCEKFTINREKGKSFYELNVRCTPCEHYIPRKELQFNKANKMRKAYCPCCGSNWIRGLNSKVGRHRSIRKRNGKILAKRY
tara:strand:- start:10 stop:327 length:318 start_codon:yes stop_codon:yes gene_type:complete